MVAHPVALATLLSACAPNIGPRTMTAIVRVESDGNPLSIHDNSANVSFAPVDLVEAIAWSKTLLAQRHSIDLGLAQINSANLPRLGMSLREAFDPCTNLRGGATILASDYRSAVYQFGAGQYALRRAIGAYNTGSLFAGFGYVSKILRAAGIRAEDDFLVPDLASMSPSIPSPYDVPVGARGGSGGSAAAGGSGSRAVPVPRRVVVRRAVGSPGASDAASVPLRAPILVTVGGVNAISPTVVGPPVGAASGGAAGGSPASGHQGPVVLRLDSSAGRPFSSPFDSPIGISRGGLPTGTAPIIAIPSPPAAVTGTGAAGAGIPAASGVLVPGAAATAAPAAAATAAPAAAATAAPAAAASAAPATK